MLLCFVSLSQQYAPRRKGTTVMRACFSLINISLRHFPYVAFRIYNYIISFRKPCQMPFRRNSFRLSDLHRLKFTSPIMLANDTKIYKEVKSAADAVSLQSDLNRLDAWSKDSGLTFNETKCEAQRISRKLKPIESSYSIKRKVPESVVTERPGG